MKLAKPIKGPVMSTSSPNLIRAHHFISSLTSEDSNIGFPNNTLRRWHKCSTASGDVQHATPCVCSTPGASFTLRKVLIPHMT